MADLRLRRGREHELGEPAAVHEAGSHRDAEHRAGRVVVDERGAGEVRAHDALGVDAVRALHDHRLLRDLRREVLQQRVFGQVAKLIFVLRERDEVVRHDVARLVEPELRHERQDAALVRYGRGQHDVERGDAVGGDHQQ